MNKMEKLKQIEHLMRYFSEGSRNRSLNKMAGKVVDEMFKGLCKEYNICYVCGKDLNSNGRIRIMEKYPSTMCREIKTTTCPDGDCQYNKDMSEKLQQTESWGGVL